MNVCIERNNIQVELIRFRKNSDFIAVGNFEVGIYFATDVLIAIRDESPLFCSGGPGVPDVSAHDHFGTRHFGTYSIRNIFTSGHVISGQARFVTAHLQHFKFLYRQFARKVGSRANSALIRYNSLRL